MHAERTEGSTLDGHRFVVPKTPDTVAAFLNPKHISVFSIVTLLPLFLMVYLSFVRGADVPIYVNIAVFFFWRCCYNVGLGVILDSQSKYQTFTKFYERHVGNPKNPQEQSCLGRLLLSITRAGLPSGHTPEQYPSAFNAWVAYKSLVGSTTQKLVLS